MLYSTMLHAIMHALINPRCQLVTPASCLTSDPSIPPPVQRADQAHREVQAANEAQQRAYEAAIAKLKSQLTGLRQAVVEAANEGNLAALAELAGFGGPSSPPAAGTDPVTPAPGLAEGRTPGSGGGTPGLLLTGGGAAGRSYTELYRKYTEVVRELRQSSLARVSVLLSHLTPFMPLPPPCSTTPGLGSGAKCASSRATSSRSLSRFRRGRRRWTGSGESGRASRRPTRGFRYGCVICVRNVWMDRLGEMCGWIVLGRCVDGSSWGDGTGWVLSFSLLAFSTVP